MVAMVAAVADSAQARGDSSSRQSHRTISSAALVSACGDKQEQQHDHDLRHNPSTCATVGMRQLRQPPAPSANQPALRRRWCTERLAARSYRLVDEVEDSSCEVDALFAELDPNLAAAGAQTHQLAGVAGLGVAGARQEPLGASNGVPPAEPRPAVAREAAGPRGCSGKDPGGTIDWEGIPQRCLLRDEESECPICLAALQPSSSSGGGGDGLAGGIAVLSMPATPMALMPSKPTPLPASCPRLALAAELSMLGWT